ncbi:DNA-binding response regulator [Streptomyces sp. SDr-06]|nr:DNA-binding response regulator [Streptomyces sp. SDr-06]
MPAEPATKVRRRGWSLRDRGGCRERGAVVRVLVVEDEQRLADLIARGLREAGHVVDVRYGGSEGLAAALNGGYDSLVLDVMLPGLDGIAVCQALRRHDRMLPVLMLTARGAVPDRVAGLDAGADDYLAKPFSFDDAHQPSRQRRAARRRKGHHRHPHHRHLQERCLGRPDRARQRTRNGSAVPPACDGAVQPR